MKHLKDLEEPEEKVAAPSEFWRSLKSPLFWQYVTVFTLMSFRIKSIQGWVYPWMDWTYAEADVEPGFVSDLLNFYGFGFSILFLAFELFSWQSLGEIF